MLSLSNLKDYSGPRLDLLVVSQSVTDMAVGSRGLDIIRGIFCNLKLSNLHLLQMHLPRVTYIFLFYTTEQLGVKGLTQGPIW